MIQQLTMDDLLQATRAALNALAKNGLTNCCLFGSMACYFYGMKNRVPHDIDILISNPNYLDPEQIKNLLVLTDPDRFYLIRARNPLATYQVLWYRISLESYEVRCKVDILVPGPVCMGLPRIPEDKVVWRAAPDALFYGASTSAMATRRITDLPSTPWWMGQGQSSNEVLLYPVMPLIPLLLLKVQGWHDHRNALQQHKKDKVYEDVEDIIEMRGIAVSWRDTDGMGGGSEEEEVNVRHDGWIEQAFLERTEGYVREFVRANSWSWGWSSGDWEWKTLGFKV